MRLGVGPVAEIPEGWRPIARVRREDFDSRIRLVGNRARTARKYSEGGEMSDEQRKEKDTEVEAHTQHVDEPAEDDEVEAHLPRKAQPRKGLPRKA
jgi:hypothetical protein